MKLTIKRNQADVKGLFGGHKGVNFELYSKVEISKEERELIQHYKVESHHLAEYEISTKKGTEIDYITVGNLINGNTIVLSSVSRLLNLEDKIKEGCQDLKNLLLVMASFGGEEVFEI